MSVVSVVKSVRSRKFLATLSALVSVAAMLMGARIASADEVWVQSYQRGSASEACVAQPGETTWQSSWGTDPTWKPSWEQWANAGQGGWTCTRSITWAKTPVASSGSGGGSGGPVTYRVGDVGPGGGLVFLISGGLTYEMAKKTWSGSSSNDTPTMNWCSNTSTNISGAQGYVVGTGSANTTDMQSPACVSGAGVSARAYRGGGFSDWFLPSGEELNAMCNYSRNPTAPAAPSVSCYLSSGTSQNVAFASGDYGFASNIYWSSTEGSGGCCAFQQSFASGASNYSFKYESLRVRPIRAF